MLVAKLSIMLKKLKGKEFYDREVYKAEMRLKEYFENSRKEVK